MILNFLPGFKKKEYFLGKHLFTDKEGGVWLR